MPRTIFGSGISHKCMHAISLLTKPQGQGPTGLRAQHSVTNDTFFFTVCVCESPDSHAAPSNKRLFPPFIKRNAFTCSVFMFLSVPWKTSSGPPCFTANEMLCACLSECLRSPLLLYVCLSVCLYLFISAFWALLSCLLIFVNMGLTSMGQVSPLKLEPAIALKTDL